MQEVFDAFGSNEELPGGSSLVRRLRACDEQAHVSIREALHKGVKRALAVVWSHYVVDLAIISEGFMDDPREELEVLDEAAEAPRAALVEKFEDDVVPPSLQDIELGKDALM